MEGYSDPSIVPKLRKDEVVNVYHAALFLHQEALAVQTPPRLEFAADLFSTTPDVTDLLYNFLAWLMYCDTSSASISAQRGKDLPADVHCRVMSVAQDIIFSANGCSPSNCEQESNHSAELVWPWSQCPSTGRTGKRSC